MNSNYKPVAVVVGATSKWHGDARKTKLAHGKVIDESDQPVVVCWGVGGAIAQKFTQEGFFVVLTTRSTTSATLLDKAIKGQGGESMIVELDLTSSESIANAFTQIREQAGNPEVLVYNSGYLEGRGHPPEKDCLRTSRWRCLNRAAHLCRRGPFLVAREVLPAMRERGKGSPS